MKISRRAALVLAVLWLVIISFLFSLPGSALPKNDWLDRIHFDKWVHFGFFYILLWLWCRALPSANRATAWLLLGLAAVYGLGVEACQHYLVKNRSFDLGDWIADVIGAVAGVWYFLRYIKK